MDARDSEIAPGRTSVAGRAQRLVLRRSLQRVGQGRRRGRGSLRRAVPALRGGPLGHPATRSAGGPQLVRDAGGVGRRAPDGEAPQHDRGQPARPRLLDGPEPHRDPDPSRNAAAGPRSSPTGTLRFAAERRSQASPGARGNKGQPHYARKTPATCGSRMRSAPSSISDWRRWTGYYVIADELDKSENAR